MDSGANRSHSMQRGKTSRKQLGEIETVETQSPAGIIRGRLEETPQGQVGIIRTRQWSQNPHLARTDFYRFLQKEYLDKETDFCENILHGMIGKADDWDRFRLGIYNPIEGDQQRVRHLDGKGSV
jgi:hypothetical protein